MPTALPFHRAVVDDPAFAPPTPSAVRGAHPLDRDRVRQHRRAATPAVRGLHRGAPARETITVEVGGKRLEVVLPAELQRSADSSVRRRRGAASHAASVHDGDALTAPMQGTIVKVAVANGDAVEVGELIVVLEAMKMEQPLTAHRAGTITELVAEAGQTVAGGAIICEIR